MSHDRITQLRIRGMRAIDDVTLDLRGLTVLIGDNGSGKSTVLEALELLRQAAKPVNFVSDILVRGHGGLQSLLRHGARELQLGVTVESGAGKMEYDFVVANVGTTPLVISETLDVYPSASSQSFRAIARKQEAAVYQADDDKLFDVHIAKDALVIADLRTPAVPALQEIGQALERIEQHVSFETRPLWQQRELGLRLGPRWPSMVEQTGALARYGINLPNCYQQLRNSGHHVWARVIERARLGLGEDLRDFQLPPSGRGNIELAVLFGSAPDNPFPAEYLSEGQLAYLAFIALVELNQERSLLAFDEPEVHLHPALLARVVWMLKEVAETSPVIVATHSDRFLDALADPASSVVLCELDEQRAMRLRRPNAERLAEWLENYRGLGTIRAEGYEPHVFDSPSGDERPVEDER